MEAESLKTQKKEGYKDSISQQLRKTKEKKNGEEWVTNAGQGQACQIPQLFPVLGNN